jgi:hypothetical protein
LLSGLSLVLAFAIFLRDRIDENHDKVVLVKDIPLYTCVGASA